MVKGSRSAKLNPQQNGKNGDTRQKTEPLTEVYDHGTPRDFRGTERVVLKDPPPRSGPAWTRLRGASLARPPNGGRGKSDIWHVPYKTR